MSTDEYVPDEADLRVAWAMFRGHYLDSNPDFEFRNAIARVRRDAWNEGWTAELDDNNPYEETP